jgi:hypothetical protein
LICPTSHPFAFIDSASSFLAGFIISELKKSPTSIYDIAVDVGPYISKNIVENIGSRTLPEVDRVKKGAKVILTFLQALNRQQTQVP